MDNRQRKIFWKLHEQLIKNLELKCYYLVKGDNENYEQKTEEIIYTIDHLQKLLQPVDKHAEVVSSYFE